MAGKEDTMQTIYEHEVKSSNYYLPSYKVRLVKEREPEEYYYSRIKPCTSPDVVAALLRDYFSEADREETVVVGFDVRKKPIFINQVAVGTLTSSLVGFPEVFKPLILSNSAYFIIAHNHPSGDANPSDVDISMTKSLCEAGELLRIPCIDHIVIGNDYYSFKEHDLIK